MKLLIELVALAMLLIALIEMVPDIIRYIKISSM
jgi:hypothetical protein